MFERKKILVLKKMFGQFCQNCILNVRELFDELFFQKVLFQFSMVFERRFFQLCRNFSTKLSKMHFMSPKKHFDKNIKLTLWIFDFGQGNVWFAAENLQPCYQICSFVSRWAIWRIVLKEFLLFSLFLDVQWIFFGFFAVSFEAWWSKLNFTSHEEHIH